MGMIAPKSRPRRIVERGYEVITRIAQNDDGIRDPAMLLRDCAVIVLGARGYYLDDLGVKGKNDANVYDDAIAIFERGRAPIAFNANVDPSKFGYSPTVRKNRAQLIGERAWPYRTGPHRGRPDHFRQPDDEDAVRMRLAVYYTDGRAEGEFVVRRTTADRVGELDEGYFAINIHSGGDTTTSSLGCQTIYAPQWPEFQRALNDALTRNGQRFPPARGIGGVGGTIGWFPYFLTEQRIA